jgi:hypothetical protein
VDWLAHAVQFLELVGIWVAPAALAARLLRHDWLPDDGALRVLLLVVPGLWLFFPIGLMSSMSALSRWVPFRWVILSRFLRVAPAALGFYLLTAIVLSAAIVPWYYALFGQRGGLLPVAAAVSGAAILIYARLLGRMGWLISRLPSTERALAKPKQERPAKRKAIKTAKKKRKPKVDVQDPWAVPEEEKARARDRRFPWAQEPESESKPASGWRPPTPDEIEGYGIASQPPPEPEPPPEKPARRSSYPSPDSPSARIPSRPRHRTRSSAASTPSPSTRSVCRTGSRCRWRC